MSHCRQTWTGQSQNSDFTRLHLNERLSLGSVHVSLTAVLILALHEPSDVFFSGSEG